MIQPPLGPYHGSSALSADMLRVSSSFSRPVSTGRSRPSGVYDGGWATVVASSSRSVETGTSAAPATRSSRNDSSAERT